MRARYPDAGEELRLLAADTLFRQLYIAPSDVADFSTAELKGATLVAGVKWGDSYLRVKNVSDKTVDGFSVKAFSFEAYDYGILNGGDLGVYPRSTYHLENSEAFLNAQGEWFYDETAQVIKYLPYDHETLENTCVRIPQTQTLLSVEGETGAKTQNVTVDGITFAYTANDYVDGKFGGQANSHLQKSSIAPQTMGESGRPVSAVNLQFVENIAFQNNSFLCLGGGALDFLQGATNVSVKGNLFQTVGGNGILVGTLQTDASKVAKSYAADQTILNTAFTVENNYLTEIGWQEYGACAIVFTYATESAIQKNTINNVTYSGISYGWGWETTVVKEGDTTLYPSAEFLHSGTIANNVITNVMSFLNDSGAIYLAGYQPNTKVYGNYIANCYNGVYKYADDYRNSAAASDGENEQIWWANVGIYLDTNAGGSTDGNKVLIHDNYVASDVANQQYEFCNTAQTFTINGKTKENCRIYMDNVVTAESVLAGAGSSLTFETPALYGTHTESETVLAVYGKGFGESYTESLTINGAAVEESAILSWSDGCIRFTTTGFNGVSANIRFANSNRVYGAMNVDYDYDSKTRFDEEYGGKDALWAMDYVNDKKSLTNVQASSSLNNYPISNLNDGHSWTIWVSDKNSETGVSWISFELETASTVSTLFLYDRTDGNNNVDEDVYAENFQIIGYTQGGVEVVLYETGATPAFEDDGMLILDISSSVYANLTFKSFKIQKANQDYLVVAEVAII